MSTLRIRPTILELKKEHTQKKSESNTKLGFSKRPKNHFFFLEFVTVEYPQRLEQSKHLYQILSPSDLRLR